MQKLQGPCSQLSNLDYKYIQQSLAGKWQHFTRVSVVKADASFLALSLSLFDRIAAFFARLVGKDYLAGKLQATKVEICEASVLEKIKKASAPVAFQNTPAAEPPAAHPPGADPVIPNHPAAASNLPVFAIPHDRKMETFHFNLQRNPNSLSEVTNALRNAPQLEIVTIDGDLVDADPAALEAFANSLAALPNLKDLSIKCLLQKPKLPHMLNGLSRCQRLEQVTLDINEVLLPQAILAVQQIRPLTSLVVNRNNILPDGHMVHQTQAQLALAQLIQNHPSLHVLVLKGFDFNLPAGNQACQNSYNDLMNALQNNRTLEQLEMDQTNIAENEAERLGKALAGNRCLKQLWITDRCAMSALGVAALLHHLPVNHNLQKIRLSVRCDVLQADLTTIAPMFAGKRRHFDIDFYFGLKPLIDLLPKR